MTVSEEWGCLAEWPAPGGELSAAPGSYKELFQPASVTTLWDYESGGKEALRAPLLARLSLIHI